MATDPYRNWLAEFYQDVDKALEKPAEQSAAGKSAAPEAPAPPINAGDIGKGLGSSEQEISALRMELGLLKQQGDTSRYQELVDKFQKIAEDRARLQDELQRLYKETAERREWQNSIQKQIADMRMKVSIAQEGYEAHIKRLEDELQKVLEKKLSLEDMTESMKTKNTLLQGAIDELRKQLKNSPGSE